MRDRRDPETRSDVVDRLKLLEEMVELLRKHAVTCDRRLDFTMERIRQLENEVDKRVL